MAKEKTFLELLGATELNQEIKDSLIAAHSVELTGLQTQLETEKGLVKERDASISELNDQLAALSTDHMKLTGVVPGTYKSKVTKKTYAFSKGVLNFQFKAANETASKSYKSVEALENPKLMEQLIEIGAGYLEEVEG